MTGKFINAGDGRKHYIPSSLSEIYDLLAVLVGYAPAFTHPSEVFMGHNIETRFQQLSKGLGLVQKKLGHDRYVALLDLTDRAKALFVEDPEDTNGKTDQGIALLYEIEDIIQSVRRGRAKAKLPDEDGEVTGD